MSGNIYIPDLNMTETGLGLDQPKSFEPEAAYDIVEQASLLLGPTIPGCTARRYDPIDPDFRDTMLCFGGDGPVMSKLVLWTTKYYAIVLGTVWYQIMAIDDGAPKGFRGPGLSGSARLDAGPQAVADIMRNSIDSFDLSGALAEGMPEKLLSDRRRFPDFWENFMLSLCAICLRRYDEAANLLDICLQHADPRRTAPRYLKNLSDAQDYARGLRSDPENVRRTVAEITENHWARLKAVTTP